MDYTEVEDESTPFLKSDKVVEVGSDFAGWVRFNRA